MYHFLLNFTYSILIWNESFSMRDRDYDHSLLVCSLSISLWLWNGKPYILFFIIKTKFCFRIFVAYQKSCKDSSEGSFTLVTPSPHVWTLTLPQYVVTTKKLKGSRYSKLDSTLNSAMLFISWGSLCSIFDSHHTAQERGHTGQEVTPIWPSQTSAFPGSTEW